MMQSTFEYWISLSAMFAVIALSAFWINVKSARTRRREQELRSAAVALDAHYDAVERLVGDPAVSEEAKAFLVLLTEAISDQKIAEQIGPAIASGSPDDQISRSHDVVEEIMKTAKVRPDIGRDFHVAFSSGLAALFLRWPSNASLFQNFSVEMVADTRKEKIVAEKLAEIARRIKDGDHNGGHGPSVIAA